MRTKDCKFSLSFIFFNQSSTDHLTHQQTNRNFNDLAMLVILYSLF